MVRVVLYKGDDWEKLWVFPGDNKPWVFFEGHRMTSRDWMALINELQPDHAQEEWGYFDLDTGEFVSG